MNKEILEVEKNIYVTAQKILDLDKLAVDAYRKRDFKTEDKFQAEIDKLFKEKMGLVKRLLVYYENVSEKSNEILEKYAESEQFMSIIGKVSQVTQPFIREISLYKGKDGKKYAYVKLDATDGFTDKVQQTKIYWSKAVVEEMINGLTRVLKEM